MSGFEQVTGVPEGFRDKVRLFPLPNLVMFPHVLQPLHIFEPRYREMLEDALADDRLIAMALLAPGWEADYEGRPSVYPVACLGKVATHQRLDDGQYNLLLQGLCRVVLVRESEPARSFREAEAQVREDYYPPDGAAKRGALQRELLERFKRLVPELPEAQEPLNQLLGSKLPLGVLTDIVAYTLDFELQFKEQLLGELNVDRRAELIVEQVSSASRRPRAVWPSSETFPPDFSSN